MQIHEALPERKKEREREREKEKERKRERASEIFKIEELKKVTLRFVVNSWAHLTLHVHGSNPKEYT